MGKRKKWKSDRVEIGMGLACDKCNTMTHRYKHRNTPQPQKGKFGYYEWWDICLSCGPTHVKHRAEAWRSFPGKKKFHNPWKARIEPRVVELKNAATKWCALSEHIEQVREQLRPPWE